MKQHPGEPMPIRWFGELPKCDICIHVMHSQTPEDGVFDVLTKAGPWANVCKHHIKEWGVALTIGYERVDDEHNDRA